MRIFVRRVGLVNGMSNEQPPSSQKPPQVIAEDELKRKLHAQVREFLSDFVREESGRVALPEAGDDEEVSQAREVARGLIQQLLQQDESVRADALRKLREDIVKYKEIRNDADGDHDDLVPPTYDGMSQGDFDGLLKMLPENAAILKEAADILQMPLEQARQDLEVG